MDPIRRPGQRRIAQCGESMTHSRLIVPLDCTGTVTLVAWGETTEEYRLSPLNRAV